MWCFCPDAACLPCCPSGVDPHDIEDAEDLLESYFIQVSRHSMARHGGTACAACSPSTQQSRQGSRQAAGQQLLVGHLTHMLVLPAPLQLQVDFILRRLLMVNERVDATEDLVSIKMDHRRCT